MRLSQLATILVLIGSSILTGRVTLWRLRHAPLPLYEIELRGGRTAHLGPRPLPALDGESPLSIVLRPQVGVTRPVFVRAEVQEQSHRHLWPVVFERTAHGTLRLQGILRELRLPCQGRCTLTLYVSDFVLPPALSWLVPDAARERYLPRAQVLKTDILIARCPERKAMSSI